MIIWMVGWMLSVGMLLRNEKDDDGKSGMLFFAFILIVLIFMWPIFIGYSIEDEFQKRKP